MFFENGTVSFENSSYMDTMADISHSEVIYVILTTVTSSLSVIGGLCICILYILYKDLRTPSRTLLLYLAISDLFLAIGNILGIIWYLHSDSVAINHSKGYCEFQSAMTIYFSMTSFFWTVTMATSLFAAVVLNNVSFTATYMSVFHLLAWVPPGVIVTVALSMGVLGTDTTLDQASWCWIDPRVPHALLWQFATGKFWEISAYLSTMMLYTAIKVVLHKQTTKKTQMLRSNKTRKDVIVEANRKLTFVPLVFIVCRIWGTLRFLLGNFAQSYINEPYVTWINPLQGIGDSAQGIANFVLYCFLTTKIRRRLKRYICPNINQEDSVLDTVVGSQTKYIRKNTIGITNDKCTHSHQVPRKYETFNVKSERRVSDSSDHEIDNVSVNHYGVEKGELESTMGDAVQTEDEQFVVVKSSMPIVATSDEQTDNYCLESSTDARLTTARIGDNQYIEDGTIVGLKAIENSSTTMK